MGAHLNKRDRWWLRVELVVPMIFQISAFALLAIFRT